MELLKKEMFNSSIFQDMQSTESQIVDRHITSTDMLKAPAELWFLYSLYYTSTLSSHIWLNGVSIKQIISTLAVVKKGHFSLT